MEQETYDWLNKNQLSYDIWEKKYRYNNESFEDWLDRVSGGDEYVRELIKKKKFLFGGRTLSNRGTGKKGSFSNCYSEGYVEDDLTDIMKTNTDIALTFKAQGGQGISLSKLRPKGCGINHGQFASDGIVPFMEMFNRTTESISQGGSRKGALIMTLDIWHKEAEDFIKIKSEEGKIQKANLSLEIDDEFMEAVKKYYDTGEVVTKTITRSYEGNEVTYEVTPIKLYKLMMEKAYDWAEPGCLFTNRFRNYNLMEYCDDYQIISCNPCGEQPLPKYGACNLGSINLSEFVMNSFEDSAFFDTLDFIQAVKTAIRGLDTVLDENLDNHALPEQRKMAMNYRNVGLGVMGMHDMLIKLGMKYGSHESIKFVDSLMDLMFRSAVIESSILAKEKGAFPAYNKDLLKSKILREHFTEGEITNFDRYGLRNCSLLSIAPTGSLGTMLNVSTGCEPLFALYYNRKTESLNGNTEKTYKVYTGVAKEYVDKYEDKLPSSLPDYFITSADISWKDRIDMQSILQKHIDTAISSTVNLPNNISQEEIEQLYLYAWEKGLKGVTIFRDGCKRAGILTTDTSKKSNDSIESSSPNNELKRGMIIKADDNCIGKKRTLVTGCGTLHCEAFFDPDTGELLETYLSKGSQGGCVDADTEYFNGTEWRRISEYRRGSNEKVLQYTESGKAELVTPINYIVNSDVETLKHFTNGYGLDMVLSEDHRMYLYKNYRKYSMGLRSNLTTEIITVKDYIERAGSKERHVPTTFTYNAPGIPLKDEHIRLLVAVYADGTYDGYKIILALKKDRKKERLRKLLRDCDIGWTERDIYNTSYTHFYIHPIPSIHQWFIDKKFTSKWYECTDHQLSIIVEECVYWDGSIGTDNRLGEYFSSKKEEVDFIQFALARLGYRATISPNNNSAGNISYRVRWTKQNVHNLAPAKISNYKTIDGHSYCFTVPSGLLVLRRNNKIFITGNCNNYMIGLSRMMSLAARGGVDIYSIVDQLKSSGTCPSYAVRRATKKDTSPGSCCPMAVGNALMDMYKEMQQELNEEPGERLVKTKKVSFTKVQKPIKTKNVQTTNAVLCPICGEPLQASGGCFSCPNDGYSKCD